MSPFPAGGGETGELMRGMDWERTPLGMPSSWPPELRTVVGVMLGSGQPMLVVWGPQRITLYNDGYAAMCGNRHPAALGRPFEELWFDIWTLVEPILDRAYAGESTHMDDIQFTMHRHGYPEETHFAFSYTPVTMADGSVGGMFCACTETTEAVAAREAAAKASEHQRRLLQHMPGFIAVLSGPDHVYEYVNDAYVAITGSRPFVGLGVREALPEIEGQGFYELLDTVYASGLPYAVRAAPIRFHGEAEERFIDFRYQPIRDEAGTVSGIFVGGYDVTEAQRSARSLAVSEDRFRRLNETLAAQVAERTAERDRAWRLSQELLVVARTDGCLEAVNDAWSRLLGWCEDELVGRSFTDLTHPDDVAPTLRAFAGILEAPLVEPYEYRLRHRDGSYRRFAWTAAFEDGKVYASGRDVTAEREREATLKDYEDFARLALTSVGGVGVWTFDVASDRFTCDAAIVDLYGLDPERASGGISRTEFMSNVHPDDIERLRATMAGGLKNPGDLELEYRIRHPGGAVRWVLSRGHTYFGEDGRPVRRTGVGIETTKQRQLEEALRQSQKMEAVGQLTGGLAHDFNNLLAGISGSLELMQTRIQQGRIGELDRYMVGAQGAAKRAAALTHRLLAFSRRQTLDPKPTDVNRLVAGMEDLVRRTVGPAIAVETVATGGLWSTLVDPPQLENALLNLCINARDAMPDGGTLTIETANRWLDDRTALERDLLPGQYVSMCVSDNGTGMPPVVIERAFDPFFTTKPIGVGTGLGLSMIYGFARQSGGQVRIYSEVGQGTMVCIYLPRHHEEEAATVDPVGRNAIEPIAAGETVLVIDDEPLVRMLVVDVLEDLGFTAIEAGDGPQGLKVLRSNARIDLLITDVGLPNGMNGRQVADAARELRPDLKVMFVTGYAENAVLSHGHLDPGMQVVTKPFDMTVLANRIKAMVSD
jgi:PAS domain S-box-containing protein